jgi:hypothetical protein
MNEPLRNSIWNFLHTFFEKFAQSWTEIVHVVAVGFAKVPLDSVPRYNPVIAEEWLHGFFFQLNWHEVYDFLEFVVENSYEISGRHVLPKDLAASVNRILEVEMSGYRFIQQELVPISSEVEIREVEEAVSHAGSAGLGGVRAHLEQSLKLLAQKPEPDYRNSIKEAISAVESAVKVITRESGGGLDRAIKEISKKAPIHPALQQGFLNLYGYTSDEGGIRHAILDEPRVGFDEAKFMLVACSAFVNFLISKAEGASLLSRDPPAAAPPPKRGPISMHLPET